MHWNPKNPRRLDDKQKTMLVVGAVVVLVAGVGMGLMLSSGSPEDSPPEQIFTPAAAGTDARPRTMAGSIMLGVERLFHRAPADAPSGKSWPVHVVGKTPGPFPVVTAGGGGGAIPVEDGGSGEGTDAKLQTQGLPGVASVEGGGGGAAAGPSVNGSTGQLPPSQVGVTHAPARGKTSRRAPARLAFRGGGSAAGRGSGASGASSSWSADASASSGGGDSGGGAGDSIQGGMAPEAGAGLGGEIDPSLVPPGWMPPPPPGPGGPPTPSPAPPPQDCAMDGSGSMCTHTVTCDVTQSASGTWGCTASCGDGELVTGGGAQHAAAYTAAGAYSMPQGSGWVCNVGQITGCSAGDIPCGSQCYAVCARMTVGQQAGP